MANATLSSSCGQLTSRTILLLILSLPASFGETAEQSSATLAGPVPLPVFVPSDIGAPATRIIGGVRGVRKDAVPIVLAPEQTSLTGDAQPVLFVYSEGLSGAALEVVIADDQGPGDRLLEANLGSISGPGIYDIDLGAQGVMLEAERVYRWSVTAIVDADKPYENPSSSGTIKWVKPDRRLRATLEGAPVTSQVDALARAGFWYDAIALVSRQIAVGDQSVPWRELRATLLDQVGLHQAAGFDRASEHAR